MFSSSSKRSGKKKSSVSRKQTEPEPLDPDPDDEYDYTGHDDSSRLNNEAFEYPSSSWDDQQSYNPQIDQPYSQSTQSPHYSVAETSAYSDASQSYSQFYSQPSDTYATTHDTTYTDETSYQHPYYPPTQESSLPHDASQSDRVAALPEGFPEHLNSTLVWTGDEMMDRRDEWINPLGEGNVAVIEGALRHFKGTKPYVTCHSSS
jgi:hypothetical protein